MTKTFRLWRLFVSIRVYSWLLSSLHIWKINVRSHSRAQTIIVSRQTDLHSEHLFDPVRDGLHVARGKLGLPIYLLDDAIEIFARKRIDTDANMLAELNQTQPGFGNINAHPEMACQDQCGGFTIRGQH